MIESGNHSTSLAADEKTWLALVAQGNELAFRHLFDTYRKKIYSYAFHLTGSETTADEILQDVFLKVWLHRQSLEQITNFNAWLHTIARNQVFDALKAMARERNSIRELGYATAQTTNQVEEHVADKENQHLLQQALNQLSPQQRLIFDLSRHTGAKHADIAGQLNISRNTVKTHLVHALRTIRAYFKYHSDQVLIVLFLITRF